MTKQEFLDYEPKPFGVIYLIKNLVNNKVYVGQTTKSIEERFKGHLYNSKYLPKRRLSKALNHYGYQNFDIQIIDYAYHTLELNLKEIFWITYYNAMNPLFGYNSAPGGEGGNTWELLEKEQQENIIEKQKQVCRNYWDNVTKEELELRKKKCQKTWDKKRESGELQKIINKRKNTYASKTEEDLKEISNTQSIKQKETWHLTRNNNKKVICLTTNVVFNSMKDAAKQVYGDEKYRYLITLSIKEKRNAKGYSWDLLNE